MIIHHSHWSNLLLPITNIVTNDVHWNCASLKAPERERPTPAGIRQEQMPQSPLQDANLVNMIQGTVETNRILAQYLRRDLHTRREEDGTRAMTGGVTAQKHFDGNSEWKTFIIKEIQ